MFCLNFTLSPDASINDNSFWVTLNLYILFVYVSCAFSKTHMRCLFQALSCFKEEWSYVLWMRTSWTLPWEMHIILLPEDVLSNILPLLRNKAGCFNISSLKNVDVSVCIRARRRFWICLSCRNQKRLKKRVMRTGRAPGMLFGFYTSLTFYTHSNLFGSYNGPCKDH